MKVLHAVSAIVLGLCSALPIGVHQSALCVHFAAKFPAECCWCKAGPDLPDCIAGRLESFFGAVTTKKSDTGKRKEPEKGKGKAGAPAKKGKSGIGKK